ncbi:hypothetical protein H072_5204 [Dactylellina haptotyla CBS 200.50]|uniref:AB hydrolase-1 domain-containing protein n=1 Tax=Dactylellina haptotyla (strain CBS 200.50) TaxID=1284197 RepID=S8C006_DACHA|nr:hypothetical protein H072_5204 [Dactylellina haptotyla CBS 200.50]
MIGTSLLDLISIRTSITLLRSITPLSILYTISIPFLPPHFLTPTTKLLSIYPISETAFYFFVYRPRKHLLQAAAEHPPLPHPIERRSLYQRIISTIPDHGSYLHQWFLGARISDIKVDNIKEFLRWSVFNSSGSWSQESDGLQEEFEINEYVGMLEDKMNFKFPEGRGSAECYRLTIDQVRMKHRPLAWYVLLNLIDTLTYLRLSFAGYSYYRRPLATFLYSFPFRFETLFTRHTSPSRTIPYWHRPHTSKTHAPILYLHGIGIGLHPYVPTLSKIASSLPDVGIIAVEIDPISSRICPPIQKQAALLQELRAILQKHNYKSFTLAANSYGTVITTHILNDPDLSSRVSSLVLIDPVTILLHLPDVAYNFLRRTPKRANEHMLHYFASTDPMVAHTLCRRFFWAENILWKEDLQGRDVVVYLGERDLIVDTASVKKYLTGDWDCERQDGEGGVITTAEFSKAGAWEETDERGGKLKVVWCEGLDHAQVFDEKVWYTRLVGDIAESSTLGVGDGEGNGT